MSISSMREWLVSLLFITGLLSAVLLLASSVHQLILENSHLFGIFRNHQYLFLSPVLLLTAVSPKVRYGPLFDLWNVITPKVIDKPWKWSIGLLHWQFRPVPLQVKMMVALRAAKNDLLEIKDLMS